MTIKIGSVAPRRKTKAGECSSASLIIHLSAGSKWILTEQASERAGSFNQSADIARRSFIFSENTAKLEDVYPPRAAPGLHVLRGIH